ncbi:unnamed protein product [Closterium sp. Naga37s-1]|nr:unnamed protein product [Closterium sp. Naga37s-1]
MGRAVVADEAAIQRHVDKLFREKATWELGLLIGRSSIASQSSSSSSSSAAAASGASREILFALVPTPEAPGAAAPVAGSRERSGSDAREWRHVDGDWVAEHALQVSRLLLGGMAVLGVYTFCSDAAYSNAAPSLLQALRSLATSLSPPASLAALLPPLPTDLILLHISSFSRRFSARSVATSSPATSAAMSPCDFKLAAIPSPILVSSTLSLHAQVPVISSPSLPPPSSSSSLPPSPPPPPPPALSPPSVRAAAASALKQIARQMDGGMAFVDGMLVEGGDVVGGESNTKGGAGKAGKGGGGKGGKGGKKGGGRGGKGGGGRGGEEAASEGSSHVRVDWALPPSWNVPLQDGAKDGHVHGMVALSGSVLALCLAMPRDPFYRVLHDLKVNAEQTRPSAGGGGVPQCTLSTSLSSTPPALSHIFQVDAVRSVVSRLDLVQDGEEEQAAQGEGGENGENRGEGREADGEYNGKARKVGEEEEVEKVEEEGGLTERPLLNGKLHRTPFTRWHLPRRVLLRCSVAGGGGRRGESEGEEEGEGGLLLADFCELGEGAEVRWGEGAEMRWGEGAEAAEERCSELCGMAAVADEAVREQGIGVEWEGSLEGEEEQSGMEGSAACAAVWLPPGTAPAKPHNSTHTDSSGSSDESAVKAGVGEKGSAGRAVSLLLAVLGVLLALVAALVMALK